MSPETSLLYKEALKVTSDFVNKHPSLFIGPSMILGGLRVKFQEMMLKKW